MAAGTSVKADGTANTGNRAEKAEHKTADGNQPKSSTSGNETSEKSGETDKALTPFDHADIIMTQLIKSHPSLYMELEHMTWDFAFRMKPQREEHLLSMMSTLLNRCYFNDPLVGSSKEVPQSMCNHLREVSRTCFRTGMEDGQSEAQKLPPGTAELKKAFESELAPQTAKDFPTDMDSLIARLRRWQNLFQRRVNGYPEHFKSISSVSKHLAELKGSDMEMFGQYGHCELNEPAVEKHVKIEQFNTEVKVVSGLSCTAWGLSIVGSDGRTYEFALETASVSGAVQAAEDRIAQVYRLLNGCVFGKDAMAQRKRIQLSVPILVGIGQRTRITSYDSESSAIVEGLETMLEEGGRDGDDGIMVFRERCAEIIKRDWMDKMEGSGRRLGMIGMRGGVRRCDYVTA